MNAHLDGYDWDADGECVGHDEIECKDGECLAALQLGPDDATYVACGSESSSVHGVDGYNPTRRNMGLWFASSSTDEFQSYSAVCKSAMAIWRFEQVPPLNVPAVLYGIQTEPMVVKAIVDACKGLALLQGVQFMNGLATATPDACLFASDSIARYVHSNLLTHGRRAADHIRESVASYFALGSIPLTREVIMDDAMEIARSARVACARPTVVVEVKCIMNSERFVKYEEILLKSYFSQIQRHLYASGALAVVVIVAQQNHSGDAADQDTMQCFLFRRHCAYQDALAVWYEEYPEFVRRAAMDHNADFVKNAPYCRANDVLAREYNPQPRLDAIAEMNAINASLVKQKSERVPQYAPDMLTCGRRGRKSATSRIVDVSRNAVYHRFVSFRDCCSWLQELQALDDDNDRLEQVNSLFNSIAKLWVR